MSNKFRPLFLAALMVLSVILVAPAAQAADSDNDGVDDADDAFPNNPDEQYDSDGDGFGDNEDECPNTYGTAEVNPGCPDDDGDGVENDLDAFPEDSDEQYDSDGDGVGDNSDAFPEDPDEQYDSDGDGMPDGWESDNGLDPEEGADAASDDDGDGLTSLEEYHHGTNPNNADTDGDGTFDSNDALPNDPDEQSDSDGDGVGDNSDTFPEDPDESEDTDNDGVGDNSDCDPEDSAVTYTNKPVSCSGLTELSYPYVAQAGSSDPPGLYDVHFAVLETEGDQCTECSNEEIDLMSSSGTLDIGDVNEFQNWSEQHEFEEFYFQYIDDNRNEQYDSGEIYVISCESSPTHMPHVVIADGRIYAYDFAQFWPDAYGINIANEDDDDDDDDDQDSDADGDGYLDEDDAFPENPDEWYDEDNDGVGSNSDCDDFDSGETRTQEEGCGETMYVQLKDYRDPCSNDPSDEGNADNNTGTVEESDCWSGYLRPDKNEVRIVLEDLDDELQYKLRILERTNNDDYNEIIFDYLVTEEGHQKKYDERIHINSDEPQYICHRDIEIALFSITPNTTEQYEVHNWHDSNSYNCQSRPQPFVMLTHGSIGGEEIKHHSSDSLFLQGASVELSFKVHNLENETNYSLQWRATDDMNNDGMGKYSYFHNETLESISSNNSNGMYEHYWTLNIPTDSCLVEIEVVLAELDYNGVNEKHGRYHVSICDWLIKLESGQDTFTSEAILNLDTQGLVLNIEDSYGIWANYYVDYASGNRDRILNQTEFDSYFEMYSEEDGDDCIDAEIGNAWTMNGQLVEKDYSYCDFTFDDTGVQFTANVLLNGSWQADANGEWVLEIYTGNIYSNCTLEVHEHKDEDGNIIDNDPDNWLCVSSRLESHHYSNSASQEDVCYQDLDNTSKPWYCRPSSKADHEPSDVYDSCDRNVYDRGEWIEFECQSEGKYRIEHYEQDECLDQTAGYYCKHIHERWQSFDGDGQTCEWDAEDNYWKCDNFGSHYYCENEPNSGSSDVSDEFTWHCTYDFGSDESFGNTTGNTHYADETMPSVVSIQNIRYGVTGSDSFDLINGKFVRDDGISLMMSVSSGSAYVDIPYRWEGLDHGRFVWTAASDDSSNETEDGIDDSNNTSAENTLPVCDVFAVANVGASGQIAASEIASKLAGNTALKAPLTGTLTVPLTVGSYEFMVDCTDADGDDLVISINDGTTTVTAEATDGHFYGGLGFIVKEESTFTHEVTVTWTDGTESGEVKVTFEAVMESELEEVASSSGLPGFTAPLSMLALLGAAMLFGRHRKDE